MDRIIGQDNALTTLRQALASGRVHHAWVFHGPAGVGKATAAKAFAKVLLCPAAQADLSGEMSACGGCESCSLIEAEDAAHPDLHVITKELALFSDDAQTRQRKLMTIPLPVLRENLVEPVARKPQLNHGKVFIIDEAELLDLNGQNTLLKTLEEPPANTYLVMVTSQDDRLLPTIRSRCQRVAFNELPNDVIEQWLTKRDDVAADRRGWLVRFARGSLGRAQLAIDYELDGWLRQVEPTVDAIGQGRPADDLGTTLAELADGFAKAWVDSHKNASKDAANKRAVRLLLGMLGQLCRERIDAATPALDPQDPIAGEAALSPWLRGIELIQQADRQLASNVAVALLLDNLAVQWGASAAASRG